MSDKLYRFGSTLRKQIDEERYLVPSKISVLELDRDSEVVLPTAFADGGLDNYAKNPVVLWAHNPWGFPVSKTTEIQIRPDHLHAVERIAVEARGPAGEMARSIWDLVLGGELSAKSIGFYPREWTEDPVFPEQKGRTYTKAELVEHSWVTVPSAPSALVERQAKGLELPSPVETALALGAKFAPLDPKEWPAFLELVSEDEDLQGKLAERRAEIAQGFEEWAQRSASDLARAYFFIDPPTDTKSSPEGESPGDDEPGPEPGTTKSVTELKAECAVLEELVGRKPAETSPAAS